MTVAVYWLVDQHQALSPAVRTWLTTQYGYAAPVEHTYAALVSIRSEGHAGAECFVTFPFTFVLTGMLAGVLEGQIDAECRSRLRAIRNAAPLTSIVGQRHPL